MMSGIIHKIDCDIYSQRIWVCFDRELSKRKFGMNIGDMTGGMVMLMENKDISVFLPHDNYGLLFNSLAHEAFHVVDFMFSGRGVDFNESGTNEHWAYMIGWVCEKVLDCANSEYRYMKKTKPDN